jgi:hypothetical protein
MLAVLLSSLSLSAAADAAPARDAADPSAPEPIDIAAPGRAPMVVLPSALPGRRPVVVALHGSNMLPQWSCGFVWETFRGAATVVCPAGDKPTIRPGTHDHTFSWSSAAAAGARADEALTAVRARFPDRVDARDPVLVAYSQSAYMAPAILASGEFRAGIVWEGFSGAIAGGPKARMPAGLRVALVPATASKLSAAQSEAHAFERAGVATQVRYAGNVGHGYAPEVKAAMRASLPQLLADLPSWS